MSKPLDSFALTGKIAVVTGASEGIGRELALGLSQAGAHVVVCSRSEEKLSAVHSAIMETGGTADVFPIDVCRTKELESLKGFLLARFGKVDVLVNSAGYVVTRPSWQISEEDWDRMAEVGLKAVFFCCQIIGSLMLDREYGKIINLSSTLSRSITPGRSVYCALKAGVSQLTAALAVEWAGHGIRVNALAPTAVRTPSRETSLQGEGLRRLVSRIPMGRLADPGDLVGAAIFLASEASDFVTGQTLFVDGGWTAEG